MTPKVQRRQARLNPSRQARDIRPEQLINHLSRNIPIHDTLRQFLKANEFDLPKHLNQLQQITLER